MCPETLVDEKYKNCADPAEFCKEQVVDSPENSEDEANGRERITDVVMFEAGVSHPVPCRPMQNQQPESECSRSDQEQRGLTKLPFPEKRPEQHCRRNSASLFRHYERNSCQ